MSFFSPPPSLPPPPSSLPPPGRAEIVDLLAALGERSAEQVRERIDSMELAWLVHRLEQRYTVELDDEQLDRIHTIDDAVAVLAETIRAHA